MTHHSPFCWIDLKGASANSAAELRAEDLIAQNLITVTSLVGWSPVWRSSLWCTAVMAHLLRQIHFCVLLATSAFILLHRHLFLYNDLEFSWQQP